jgi:hypothetical protein
MFDAIPAMYFCKKIASLALERAIFFRELVFLIAVCVPYTIKTVAGSKNKGVVVGARNCYWQVFHKDRGVPELSTSY